MFTLLGLLHEQRRRLMGESTVGGGDLFVLALWISVFGLILLPSAAFLWPMAILLAVLAIVAILTLLFLPFGVLLL